MKITLQLDNIIYKLQRSGGITKYWQEITSRISNNSTFDINYIQGNYLNRYYPIISNADIFHSSYYRINLSTKIKNVVTVHDFLYEFGFLKTLSNPLNIWQKKLAIHKADAIICVSENTKKDLLLIYPHLSDKNNLHVVHHGTSFNLNNLFDIQRVSNRIKELTSVTQDKYILFVGKRGGYKNFKSVALGFASSNLPKLGYFLICTGSKFLPEEEKFFTSLGLKNKVFVVAHATYNELTYLYQYALTLVYPSLYEGFGLPPLEAMSCGCPVIGLNSSSIPEVVGDAGILLKSADPQSICYALESLLDQKTRKTYVDKGLVRAKLFSWDNAAQKHIDIYKSLLSEV